MTTTNENGVPVVEVQLDRPRQLTLSLAAMRRLKSEEGPGIAALDRLAMGGEDGEVLDFVDGIVWVAMADHAPEVTREQVAGMIHLGNLGAIMTAIVALMAPSLPEADPDPLAEKPAKKGPARAKKAKPKS